MYKRDLKRELSSIDSVEALKNAFAAASDFFEAIDSPRSLTCYMMLKYEMYEELINLSCDPLNYLTAWSFRDDYAATSFLSKFPNFDTKIDRVAVARKKFFEAETICQETNRHLKLIRDDPLKAGPDFHTIIRMASRKISRLLGSCDLDSISDKFGWGPGATTSVGGQSTAAYNKFVGPLDVTTNALVMGHCCVNSIPSWANLIVRSGETPSVECSVLRTAFNVVKGNEIVFVPKNAKTDRVIAIEPHVNSYLQKGFGAEIRRKLRKNAGIDLNNQSVNQHLAREGSIDGSLCTMDLSMASDTISIEIVRDLLPEDWFMHLSSLRSPQGYFRDTKETVTYSKFSSMGNGFTFELESLIFYAIVKSCCEFLGLDGVVSVYGDDLIFPSDAYDFVTKIILEAGFRVNASKSFASGAFRESCGKDYFSGTDVRPIFLKESLLNVESLYKLANSIRRFSRSSGFNHFCDRRFLAVWSTLVSSIPSHLRLKIPEGFGDVGLISNFDEACPPRARDGWEGYLFNCISRIAVKRTMTDEASGVCVRLDSW